MVLVKEDNLPPLQWSLGRVVQVFPGDDGAVRVVDVKTQRGQFRRPITNSEIGSVSQNRGASRFIFRLFHTKILKRTLCLVHLIASDWSRNQRRVTSFQTPRVY
ncbi:hypothetical protein TNCV_3455381 [Trichonephila clavipes]|nr:hypothetical protein TNCV_3455381 [Trichonephila clavipes]